MQAPAESAIGNIMAAGGRRLRPLWFAAVGVAVLLGATVSLWAYYGTAVFYETILAGLAACM